MRFAAARAAWHASGFPLTGMPAQELYVVALMPPTPALSLVKTPAFRYMLARMASAPLLVKRPLSPASRVGGSPESRAAISSFSMKSNNPRGGGGGGFRFA